MMDMPIRQQSKQPLYCIVTLNAFLDRGKPQLLCAVWEPESRWKGRDLRLKTLVLGFGSGSVLAELGLIRTGGGWPTIEISGLSGILMWVHEDKWGVRGVSVVCRLLRTCVALFAAGMTDTGVYTYLHIPYVVCSLYSTLKYCINNPAPSYLFDAAYRIGLAAAPLRGWLCSAGMTAGIYHKSLQISMLARAE